ncbi:SatD family protein [Flavobacterium buctense]|uniref:SatD family protein n=1 Tax=Flavobacterium buctense TaxID=1648146 RepID=A0ABU9DYW2_9FLAO|nr:SatD family protein [Flavobacterium buctense]
MYYAILMADILDSGEKDSNKLMLEFKSIVNYINENQRNNIISPLTITLGDEFQAIIDTVENAVNIIIEIEEFILSKGLSFKLRYVLNFGKVETQINRQIAYEMLGKGLTDARKELNNLKNSESRFLIKLKKEEWRVEKMLNDTFRIFQYFIDSWKINEYKIVSDFIIHDDYKTIANKFEINRSTAWRRRKSLNIEEFETLKKIIYNITYIYEHDLAK